MTARSAAVVAAAGHPKPLLHSFVSFSINEGHVILLWQKTEVCILVWVPRERLDDLLGYVR